MRESDDGKLKGMFRDLRAEDQERVPEFASVMEKVREEASRSGLALFPENRIHTLGHRRLAWGGSILAAAAAAVILFVHLPRTTDAEFVQVVRMFSSDPSSGAWTSPTDALLDIPGKEILSTVPSIGSSQLLPSPGATPRKNDS